MDYISLTSRSNVLILQLSRPEKLNAINKGMWIEIKEAIDKVCMDEDSYLGIVITGSGRAFSSGDDIYDMYSLKDYSDSKEFFSRIYSVFRSIALCIKPIVAAVNGLAVGGGAELLLVVDSAVAIKDAWFSFPEGLLGLIPPVLATIGVSQFGFRRARYLALTGRRITAMEARDLGLIDVIVDDRSMLIDKAIEIVYEISKIPASARREIKRLTVLGYLDLLERSIDSLAKLAVERDAKHLMKRFIES